MKFNPMTGLEYARKFSFPRQVGTSAESKAAEEIAGNLEQSGFVVHYQDFRFSAAFERVLSVELLLGMVLVLSILLTNGISLWITLVLSGLLISLILLISRINHLVQRNSFGFEAESESSLLASILWKLGKLYQTKNIVANLPGSAADRSLPHLYLIAHYDSKSQYLPLVIRIALFVVVIAGSLIFASLSLINLVIGSFTPFMFALGILVIICALPLLFLDYGNDSPGAIDDASGLGLVLHLAEVIANQPDWREKLGLTILIAGAEELAVKGSLAYVQKNDADLKSQAEGGGLYVLNFDGIGMDGKLYMAGSDRGQAQNQGSGIYRLVQRSAEELGISLGSFFLPGAMFDHVPFVETGYDAVSLIGIGKDSLSIHTANDSPEKLHVRGFDQAGQLALRLIENLPAEKS